MDKMEDRFIIVTYDGYIKNWEDLCEELGIDISFKKKEREEQILKLGYEKWNSKLPEHLRGYFAFCLKDRITEDYFCARDRFGAIPFYYYDNAVSFRCGTEIKEVVGNGDVPKVFQEQALQLYLMFSYVPGEITFYQGIRRLRPGHTLLVTRGHFQICRYDKGYRSETFQSIQSQEEAAEALDAEIRRSVSECDPEMEKGAFLLSGGVDSTYLFAVSAVEEAFSVGFEDDRYDESLLALKNSTHFGKKCNRVIVSPEMFFSGVEEGMRRLEQPLGTAASIAFMLGCNKASGSVSLLYTGEGADELFAGYDIYSEYERYHNGNIYTGKNRIFWKEECEKLLQHCDSELNPEDVVKMYCPADTWVSGLDYMRAVDISLWLEGNSFLNSYQMAKGAGLSVRMPLIDENIFQFAFSLPSRDIIQASENKIILRKAAEKVISPEIAERPKSGFVTPIRYWLADPDHNEDVRRRFYGETASIFFNKRNLEELLQAYSNGKYDLWRKVWTIYTFLVWYESVFDGH